MASLKMHLSKSSINALPIIGDRGHPIPCVAWDPAQPGPDWPLLIWDDEVPAFVLSVARPVRDRTTGKARARKTFWSRRRTIDQEHSVLRIGQFDVEITAEQARAEARRINAQIVQGQKPAAERRAARRQRKERQAAPTVAELWEACQEAHKRAWSANTARSYRSWFATHVALELGKLKAHEVASADVRRVYAKVLQRSPSTATQVLRLTSSLYAWAVASDDYPMIMANPCTGAIDRNSRGPGANRRERYPVGGELDRLVTALVARDDLFGRYFLLLLLTGCREGELLNAKWSDFDLESATWIKPASATKQRKLHRLPLNPEAVAVLREVKELSPFQPFAGVREHTLRRTWAAICKAAALEDLRVHDLRHWHASLAASSGESLLVIGGLLGHANQATTARYSHLVDHSIRAASARVGQVISLAGRKP